MLAWGSQVRLQVQVQAQVSSLGRSMKATTIRKAKEITLEALVAVAEGLELVPAKEQKVQQRCHQLLKLVQLPVVLGALLEVVLQLQALLE